MRFRFVLLWFAITVAFEVYGFFKPEAQINGDPFSIRTAVRGAVLFGIFGVGVATCATLGAFIVDRVYRRRIRKRWAIACLAGSSVVSAIATPLFGFIVHDRPPWYILGGEEALGIVDVTGWMIVAAGAGFVLFTVLVFLVAGQPESESPLSSDHG